MRSQPKLAFLFTVVIAVPLVAKCQVLAISGGSSTIAASEGASLTMYLGDHSVSQVSGGFADGRLLVGASEETNVGPVKLSFGDVNLPASLPADFGSGMFGFPGRGASAEYTGTSGNKLIVFSGVATQFFGFPSMYGSLMNGRPTTLISYECPIWSDLTFDSYNVFSSRQTSIQSITWHPSSNFHMALSEGMGNNAPYIGAIFEFKTNWSALRVGYALSGPSFRVVTAPNLLLVANTGLNVTGSVTPRKWFTISGSQIGYESSPGSSQFLSRPTVDSISVSAGSSRFGITESTYIDRAPASPITVGEQVGGSLNLRRIQLQSNYGRSGKFQSLINTATEHLTRHLEVSEYVDTTGGGTSVNAGAAYTSNAISVSVGYAQEFLPVAPSRNPFVKILTAALTLNFKDIHLSGSTQRDASGARYTAIGSTYLYLPGSDGIRAGGAHHKMNKYSVVGVVQDRNGKPVMGAAIRVGKQIVWTNSSGVFQVSVKKARVIEVMVLPEDFTEFGDWGVVDAPDVATPAEKPEPLRIVVKRD